MSIFDLLKANHEHNRRAYQATHARLAFLVSALEVFQVQYPEGVAFHVKEAKAVLEHEKWIEPKL